MTMRLSNNSCAIYFLQLFGKCQAPNKLLHYWKASQ
jgi:hypothetical protein